MLLSNIDVYIIFIYLLAVLAIGFMLYGKNNHPEAFMVAKRALPGWLIGFSIFATTVSNITVVGFTGKLFFSEDLSAMAKLLPLPIAIWLTCKYIIPFHRKNGHVSAYTHFEKRFGAWATLYGALAYIAGQTFRMATIMFLISLVLGSLFDTNQYLIILITGVVVIGYTYSGGIEAVIWTDFIQGVIIIVGILISIFYIFMNMPEGAGQVLSIAQEHNKLSMGDMGFDLAKGGFWTVLIMGFSMFMQDFGIVQTYVQRYMSAKSLKEAQRGLWATVWLVGPLMLMIALLGVGLFAFYTAQPKLSALENIFTMKADSIFPHFIVTQLPVGIKGVMIAAILASAMSSIDSSLNGIATLYHTNIHVRYINKHPGERKSMDVLHRVSIIAGVLGIGIAMSMMHVKSIWDTWYTVSTIIAGAIFGLFLIGLLCKRAGGGIAGASVIVGALCIGWMTLSDKLDFIPIVMQSPFHGLAKGAIGTLVILSCGVILTGIKRLICEDKGV